MDTEGEKDEARLFLGGSNSRLCYALACFVVVQNCLARILSHAACLCERESVKRSQACPRTTFRPASSTRRPHLERSLHNLPQAPLVRLDHCRNGASARRHQEK